MENYDKLQKEYYAPSRSYEYYDKKTDTYYNCGGQELIHPDYYDYDNEDYYNYNY